MHVRSYCSKGECEETAGGLASARRLLHMEYSPGGGLLGHHVEPRGHGSRQNRCHEWEAMRSLRTFGSTSRQRHKLSRVAPAGCAQSIHHVARDLDALHADGCLPSGYALRWHLSLRNSEAAFTPTQQRFSSNVAAASLALTCTSERLRAGRVVCISCSAVCEAAHVATSACRPAVARAQAKRGL